jgi:membrane-associated phospholipid phosphatase
MVGRSHRGLATVVMTAVLAATGNTAAAGADVPFSLRREREIALTAASAASLAVSLLLDAGQDLPGTDDLASFDPDDVNAFDRPATDNWSPDADRTADWLVAATAAAPLLLVAGGSGRDEPGVILAMYGEALLLSTGVVQLLKVAADRARPYLYNEDPRIPEQMRTEQSAVRSFPSGHTATAFTAAVFLGTVYGELHPAGPGRGWVWAGGLTAATTVGWLRVRSGAHFPTDVLAGAAIGGLAGWLVPRAHLAEGRMPAVYIAPDAGLGLAWSGCF